jgi:hypothetical protein
MVVVLLSGVMTKLQELREAYRAAVNSPDASTTLRAALGVEGPDSVALTSGKAFKASQSVIRREG